MKVNQRWNPTSGHLYPQRLHHGTPSWVESEAVFHVRLRTSSKNKTELVEPVLAKKLLLAVTHYHARRRWGCRLFLLMPDHAHMLATFPARGNMARVIGDWKRYTVKNFGVHWQTNFFDHRIRHEAEFREKWDYVLRNPVAKNLCHAADTWPWVLLPE